MREVGYTSGAALADRVAYVFLNIAEDSGLFFRPKFGVTWKRLWLGHGLAIAEAERVCGHAAIDCLFAPVVEFNGLLDLVLNVAV